MNQLTDLHALLPIWPELLLACGAILLGLSLLPLGDRPA